MYAGLIIGGIMKKVTFARWSSKQGIYLITRCARYLNVIAKVERALEKSDVLRKYFKKALTDI